MKRIKTPYLITHGSVAVALAWLCSACQVLTYTAPSGERFSRSSFATTTSIASLAIETGTNGIRRVQMKGYQQDPTQALGVVTEAAVRAALQATK